MDIHGLARRARTFLAQRREDRAMLQAFADAPAMRREVELLTCRAQGEQPITTTGSRAGRRSSAVPYAA